jgi:putative flippase GtrA
MGSTGSDRERRTGRRLLATEIAKFGVVGGACYVIDFGSYNAFHAGLGWGPLTCKVLAAVLAATAAYLGNRHWSFRHRARTGLPRECALFFAMNAIGLGIALACLGFSYYILGLHGVLAQNVSGNVVGIGLGTLFRFCAYQRLVFLNPDNVKAARPRTGLAPRTSGLSRSEPAMELGA